MENRRKAGDHAATIRVASQPHNPDVVAFRICQHPLSGSMLANSSSHQTVMHLFCPLTHLGHRAPSKAEQSPVVAGPIGPLTVVVGSPVPNYLA